MHCMSCRHWQPHQRRGRSRGARLAELRRDRGHTQEEFAELIHVSPRHLRRVEAGQTDQLDNLRALDRIAQALDMPLGDLLTALADNGASDSPSSPSVAPSTVDGITND